MSKLFFDNIINLEKVAKKISEVSSTSEEKEELWFLVDEMVTHKVLETILSRLPRAHHEEFLNIFHESPHDEVRIFEYLSRQIGENIQEIILQELGVLEDDIMSDISSS